MIDFAAEILVKELRYITSVDVLSGKVDYKSVPLSLLQQICFHTSEGLNESALIRKLHYLKDWVELKLQDEYWKLDADALERTETDGIGIFDLVHCLSKELITSTQGKMVYRYKYLNTWHYLSGNIGTNLFIGSVYAHRDHLSSITRENFANMDIFTHDNLPLNEVLNRGMSENHFHLRGSVPYFKLSWLSLMNSVMSNQVALKMDQIDEHPRNPKVRYRHSYSECKFSILHLKAAAIRVCLYAFLTGNMLEFGEYTVSLEWILDSILRSEPYAGSLSVADDPDSYTEYRTSEKLFHKTTYPMEDNDSGLSIQQYLEDQLGEQGIEQVKNICPGFYWIFWNCFPYIPLHCLQKGSKILCRENQRRMGVYVNKCYPPLLLSRCAWLFQGKSKQLYEKEWKWQTKKTIVRMMQDTMVLVRSKSQIQHAIDNFHVQNNSQHKDYAMNSVANGMAPKEQEIDFGERWLIYQMEYRRYKIKETDRQQDDWLYQLYFAYLIMKEGFRNELLQNDDKIGFDHFQAYQKRKTWFTTAFTEGELAKIAVAGAFRSQKLNCLELRIMPQDTCEKNLSMLRRYDEALKEHGQFPNKFYYVFHFGRETDSMKNENALRCRHEDFRYKLKTKAQAIMLMRRRNPSVGGRLKGIDACSSEDGCRPEVFGTVFRALKAHSVYRPDLKSKLSQLRISYHVGEENQDVLDGLRAINEAVYFLNMESGDRLGHATMLGVSVQEWYAKNDYMISIRQQDYLDNVVWLYHQLIHYHVSNQDNLLEYLEHEFQKYFNRVYERSMDDAYNYEILKLKGKYEQNSENGKFRSLHFNIHNYYYAWELRGDDPILYQDGFYKRYLMPGGRWDDYRLNRLVNPEKRSMDEAEVLYHTYHYNSKVRIEGDRAVVVKIPYYMVCGIEFVQKKLQMDIAQRGISIETNPTSNLRIGGLAGYESHPITAFYNKGLELSESKVLDCPQICVSINTDDLGVFTTSLYNEFTLMASALENMKNIDGTYVYKKDMVYDWINEIRIMGNRQSFYENEEEANMVANDSNQLRSKEASNSIK